jgi:hypothetical protein
MELTEFEDSMGSLGIKQCDNDDARLRGLFVCHDVVAVAPEMLRFRLVLARRMEEYT